MILSKDGCLLQQRYNNNKNLYFYVSTKIEGFKVKTLTPYTILKSLRDKKI